LSLVDARVLVSGLNGKGEKDWSPITVPANKRIWNVKWSPDESRMFSFGYDKIIWVHDSNDNYKVMRELKGHSDCVGDIQFINSNVLVSCGHDSHIYMWDLSKPAGSELIQKMENAHSNNIW
jgi:WD40 repeat protein